MASLTERDLAMFAKLGIPPELLDLAGVTRVTDQEARSFGIRGVGSMSGIMYHYWDPLSILNGRHRRTSRLRRDDPDVEDGRIKRKYVSAYGDRRHLYFPPTAPDLIADNSVPIVLVEAEKSCLALTAWASRNNKRLLVIAMGGAYGWRGRIGNKEDSR